MLLTRQPSETKLDTCSKTETKLENSKKPNAADLKEEWMDSSLEEKVGQLSVESGHENSEWEECFDENSGNKYWYNSLEGKSTWDDPFDNSANGGGYAITVADAGEGDSRALVGDESKEEIEEEDYSGLKEALSCFTCPPLVPKRWTDFGNSVLFHGVDNPSPFFRVNVFKAENPYREAFKPNEDVDHSIWTKKMILYTFRHQMPNTVYYNISYAMNPYRTRLLPEKLGSQLKRDISRWGKSREEVRFCCVRKWVYGVVLVVFG